VVILRTGFLANPLQNAENSTKFASRPSVQCGCAPVFTKTQNSSAALHGRILCSVSPAFIINMGTVDQNQFSPISRVCVPLNSMSASQIFVKSLYTDLHDNPTDGLVPAILDGRADVSHLQRSFLLNKKCQKGIS